MERPELASQTASAVSSETVDAPAFFITGGTLPLGAASYVARAADEELYQILRRGEFCYVLNTRQMGKSSLMIRTARRLREAGRQVLILDLTGVGQNLSVEQWYFGLLDLVATQAGYEDELFAFWKSHKELGPMQRFVALLRRILLKAHEPDAPRDLVVFVDEIDAVRSLPFSADEFFAGIRECFNRSAQDADAGHLTFCLLGVATPSDLIRDTRVSPFNIGRRIELHDFTREEAAPLALGLRQGPDDTNAEALLDRVLYWTGGHPYMTQRLCRAVAENLNAQQTEGKGSSSKRDEIEDAVLVDTLCQSLFLTKSARETDDNLAFVRTRLLHSEEDKAALLDLYGQVRRGKRIKDDETNALCPVLRLSGVVKAANGWLVLRNEIYARVFDAHWIAENMPDAEVRRQKRAYRLGVMRAAAVFGSVSVVIGLLLFVAVGNARRARFAEGQLQKEAAYARKQEQTASQLLYDASMPQIQWEWERGNFTGAAGMLDETGRSPARNFEWDYWHRLQNEITAPLPMKSPFYTLIAPDNRTLGEVTQDEQSPEKGQFTAQDIFTGATRFSLPARFSVATPLDYAPDGSRFLLCVGKTVEVRDMRNGRLLQIIPAQQEDINAFHFSADGAAIYVARFTARAEGTLSLWDCRTEKTRWEHKTPRGYVICIAVSANRVATLTVIPPVTEKTKKRVTYLEQVKLQIWDERIGSELYSNDRDFARWPLAFSPNGRLLVGGMVILDLSTRKTHPVIGTLGLGEIYSSYFSPDGRRLTVGCGSRICVYDVASGRCLSDPTKSSTGFKLLLLSPNGRFALRAEGDDKYHFVRTEPMEEAQRLIPPAAPSRPPDGKAHRAALWRIRYSPDGSQVAAGSSDGNVYLWDTSAGKLLRTLHGDGVRTSVVSFSHDGNRLAAGDTEGRVSLWDLHSGKRFTAFRAHVTPDTHLPDQTGGVNDICFTLDDRQILTAGDDYTVKIWDLPEDSRAIPRLHRVLTGHKKAVECLALSPDGATLLTGSDDMTAKLWDYRSGHLLAPFKAPAEIWGAAFSPDSRQVVLATLWKTAEVWDIGTKQKIHVLSGHLDWVTDVAFSPDGKRIVSVSRDHTAKLWDAQTGRELLTLHGHSKQVIGVAFAPNGHQIATSSSDGEARLWNTVPDSPRNSNLPAAMPIMP